MALDQVMEMTNVAKRGADRNYGKKRMWMWMDHSLKVIEWDFVKLLNSSCYLFIHYVASMKVLQAMSMPLSRSKCILKGYGILCLFLGTMEIT